MTGVTPEIRRDIEIPGPVRDADAAHRGRHQSPSLRTKPLRHSSVATADLLTPRDLAIRVDVSPRWKRRPSRST
jgi:hypothetical protein